MADEHEQPVEQIDDGPPPSLRRRRLIFDALRNIVEDREMKGSASVGTFAFAWGAGYHGQLGRKQQRGQKKYSNEPVFVAMEGNTSVAQVHAGGLHSTVVTSRGHVLSWGDGRSWQLGHEHEGFVSQATPRLVDSLAGEHTICQVACGQSHTLALTRNGDMFSWGFGRYGQTGQGDRQNVRLPQKLAPIPDLEGAAVVSISCGDKHSAALLSDGRVYTWGCGEHGQLGLGFLGTSSDVLVPTQVGPDFFRGENPNTHQDERENQLKAESHRIVQVECGAIFTAFVRADGAVFVSGFGEYLYPGQSQNFFYEPLRISLPRGTRVSRVACGQSHIVALTESKEVVTWGSGEYGQLGHGVRHNSTIAKVVLPASKNVVSIAAGRYHSLALTGMGTVYVWGNNDNGQLGLPQGDPTIVPKVLEAALPMVVGQVDCGEHHTMALTSTRWSALSSEIEEWLAAETHEHSLKIQILRKTNRVLTRKDLTEIAEEMTKWQAAREKTKQAAREQDRKTEKRGVDAVQSVKDVRRDISLSVPAVRKIAPRLSRTEGGDAATLLSVTTQDTTALAVAAAEEEFGRKGSPSAADKEAHIVAAPSVPPSGSEALPIEKEKRSATIVPKSSASGSDSGMLSPGPHERSATRRGDASNVTNLAPNAKASRVVFLRDAAGLVEHMTQTLSQDGGGEISAAQLEEAMTAQVFDLRKQLDKLKCATEQKRQRLIEIRRELNYMTEAEKSMKEARARRAEELQRLTMQLDTVTIKIAEAEENRRNYELNISHLKEEELERFFYMESLRKQTAETNALCRKMLSLRKDAQQEQQASEQNLQAFRQETEELMTLAEQQLKRIQTIHEQRQEQRKERMEARAAEDANAARAQREAQRARVVEATKAKETQRTLETQLEQALQERAELEQQMEQVRKVTGLTDPEKIIEQYFVKTQIKNELEAEAQRKHEELAALRDQVAAVDEQLMQLSQSDSTTDLRWRDVDERQRALLAEQARVERLAAEARASEQELSRLQQAVAAMLAQLAALAPKETAKQVRHDVRRLLAQVAAIAAQKQQFRDEAAALAAGEKEEETSVLNVWPTELFVSAIELLQKHFDDIRQRVHDGTYEPCAVPLAKSNTPGGGERGESSHTEDSNTTSNTKSHRRTKPRARGTAKARR
ncbi:MAG: hypothetical protein MHM6MM_002938 [Cercozoa sp. M6MM]